MRGYFIRLPYGIDTLELGEKKIGELSPGQVLIQIKAAALNYRDRLVMNGIGLWKAPEGRIPGSDGMGVIVKKGDEVKFNIGQRVAVVFFPRWMSGKVSPEKLANPLGGAARDGTLQEYMIVEQDELVVIPEFFSNEEAATLPCAALTAWNSMFVNGNVKKNDYVLIQGTGGVSLFALQFALAIKARPILLSGSDEKLEKVSRLGVDHLINYVTTPNWEDMVLKMTAGRGINHVVEVVGGDNLGKSLYVAASESTISLIGLIEGLTSQIDLSTVMRKQIKLQGIEVGSKDMLTSMIEFLNENKIRPIIDSIYPFKDLKAALHKLEHGKHFGKICISI